MCDPIRRIVTQEAATRVGRRPGAMSHLVTSEVVDLQWLNVRVQGWEFNNDFITNYDNLNALVRVLRAFDAL
ncbi:hypothetical protein DPMN_172163 [Dreissena polymorpha]|uniref:Uncharacterized protein n=1 Tax=Dreissena polymorpha TaxID=45954 RepID=A0A9D4E0A8_DREPO|nr:hypothetical protein DPMN_172163 [Dreissena polymorpha]